MTTNRTYPNGRLNGDDDGLTQIAIAADLQKSIIIMRFEQPMEWVAMDAQTGIGFLQSIARNLAKITGVPITIRIDEPVATANIPDLDSTGIDSDRLDRAKAMASVNIPDLDFTRIDGDRLEQAKALILLDGDDETLLRETIALTTDLFANPDPTAKLEWFEDGDKHYLLLPNSINQVGIRQVRLELAPSGWVAVVKSYTHQVSAEVLSDETRFMLSHLPLEDAKIDVIGRLRHMIQSALLDLQPSAPAVEAVTHEN